MVSLKQEIGKLDLWGPRMRYCKGRHRKPKGRLHQKIVGGLFGCFGMVLSTATQVNSGQQIFESKIQTHSNAPVQHNELASK